MNRVILAAALAIGITSAVGAQEPTVPAGSAATGTTHALMSQFKCQEPYPGVAEVAKRLGIEPGVRRRDDADTGPHVMISACAKGEYDLFAIVNAVLDRLDNTISVAQPGCGIVELPGAPKAGTTIGCWAPNHQNNGAAPLNAPKER